MLHQPLKFILLAHDFIFLARNGLDCPLYCSVIVVEVVRDQMAAILLRDRRLANLTRWGGGGAVKSYQRTPGLIW